jgi:2-polyprenyl-3-methyl-5-hydroxy-6-metoxy-1,4-benzoquinol methylase
MKNQPKIEEIRDWWNSNSYSYGINSQSKYRDTGIPNSDNVLQIIAEYERKYLKHLKESCDSKGRPAGSFIPYDDVFGKEVLDVACGLGWASINLARAGANVTGIDLTPNALSFARKYSQSQNLEIQFNEMSAEKIEFGDSRFDFVLGWGFLMHTENPEVALNELIRVCKPGGKVVLYFYYKHSVTFWFNIFLLRGVLLGQLIRYRGNILKLVSRNTDGDSFGGNVRTDVLSRSWFRNNISKIEEVDLEFQGWGPPSLLDNFPLRKLPLGRLFPLPLKIAISNRFGFGHILTIQKVEPRFIK